VDDNDFQGLIASHYPRIRRAALVLSGGNDWDADDLAQETMLQAARGWRRFSGRSRPETWLFAILLNLHRRRLRSAERGWRVWLGWFAARPTVDERPDHKLQAEEWGRSLWSAVAELPEPQKQAVLLRYAEDFSYQAIADVLGCPIGTVKSRLHHALAALEQKLSAREPADQQVSCRLDEISEARP
jgi:RNA polymerase sigma-70 factor, ECF subfamily